jgi:hypothetical protein
LEGTEHKFAFRTSRAYLPLKFGSGTYHLAGHEHILLPPHASNSSSLKCEGEELHSVSSPTQSAVQIVLIQIKLSTYVGYYYTFYYFYPCILSVIRVPGI